MDSTIRRNIVISAVNLRKGGTLTVLRDCLQYLSSREDLHVTALVHRRELCDYPGIDYIEIPWSIGSWFQRLKCEYFTMWNISKELPETDLWLSLHDTTPRVKARRQAVYCHTPFPFMKPRLRDWVMDYKIPVFSLMTRYVYRFRSHRNKYLVVQQEWLRDGLARMLRLEHERFILAPPSFTPMPIPTGDSRSKPGMTFIYPATADVHKDFETLCQAARILEGRLGTGHFQVILTVKGNENRYARYLKKHWGDVASIDFHGLFSREELAQAYGKADCLVFPSRAETWGLPISEFLPTGKPMILADLPYAHDTAAGAACVGWFPVCNATVLADRMQAVIEGQLDEFRPVPQSACREPYASDWASLFDILLR